MSQKPPTKANHRPNDDVLGGKPLEKPTFSFEEIGFPLMVPIVVLAMAFLRCLLTALNQNSFFFFFFCKTLFFNEIPSKAERARLCIYAVQWLGAGCRMVSGVSN